MLYNLHHVRHKRLRPYPWKCHSSSQAASAATDSIPILGTSITDYATALDMSDWSGTTGKNISGTTDLAPLDEQAKCIKELFPDAKNIGIIYCSSEPNSIYQSTTITKYLEDEGYTVKEYTFSDSNDVAAVTQSACDALMQSTSQLTTLLLHVQRLSTM